MDISGNVVVNTSTDHINTLKVCLDLLHYIIVYLQLKYLIFVNKLQSSFYIHREICCYFYYFYYSISVKCIDT